MSTTATSTATDSAATDYYAHELDVTALVSSVQLVLASEVARYILSSYIAQNAITEIGMLYPELNQSSVVARIARQRRRGARQAADAERAPSYLITLTMSLNPASYTRVNEITRDLSEAGGALLSFKRAVVSSVVASATPLQSSESGVSGFVSPEPSQVSVYLGDYRRPDSQPSGTPRATGQVAASAERTTAPPPTEKNSLGSTSGGDEFWTRETIQIFAIAGASVLVLVLVCAAFAKCGPESQGYDTDETGSQFDSSYQFAIPGTFADNSLDSSRYGGGPSYVVNAGYDQGPVVSPDAPELNSWV